VRIVFLKLAFIEYFRSISVRAPGGRDFLWTTLLMFFVQLLALVIMSAREGVLERSVDAFLGNKPGFGIPIWTLPNFLGENQPILITTDLIGEVQNGGYLAAPFRRLSNDQMIRLPEKTIWAENTKIDEIKFAGMAVDFSGPMVPLETVDTLPAGDIEKTGNWDIILDEKLFIKYFDLAEYARSLEGLIPQSKIDLIPTSKEQLTDMKEIWLKLKVHQSEYLMPFNVKWSKYFGIGASSTAYLVPLELFNLFVVAKENPKLCAFLESGPQLGRRVLSLKSDRLLGMPLTERTAIKADFEKLAIVMGGTVENIGSRISLYFGDRKKNQSKLRRACDAGVSELRLNLFAKDLGLNNISDQLNEVIETASKLEGHTNRVLANCNVLGERTLKNAKITGEGNNCVAEISMATAGTGYSEMLLFARKRLEIKQLVDFMSCRPSEKNPNPLNRGSLCIPASETNNIPESRLMINQIYEDSLTRFGFLTELLNGISGPIGVVMIGMLAAILWVQLGTVLDHRRFRYAMLLSNGITWFQLKAMIITQVVLGVCISLIFAVFSFMLIKYYLINGMSEISTVYEKITLGNAIDVLPVSLASVLVVLSATMTIAIVLTLIQLMLNKLSPGKPLESLLS
jgi:hypothetical protein